MKKKLIIIIPAGTVLALIAAFANQDVVDFINANYPGSVIPSAELAVE